MLTLSLLVGVILFFNGCTTWPYLKKSDLPDFSTASAPDPPADYFFTIPREERIVMRLQTPLHTKTTQPGEYCELVTIHDVFLSLQHGLLLPSGTRVRARVERVRRGKSIWWGPRLELQFEEIILGDDLRVPFDASVLRVLGVTTRQGRDIILREGTLVEAVANQDLFIPSSASVLAPWAPVAAAEPVKLYSNEPVNRGGLRVDRRPEPLGGHEEQGSGRDEPVKLVAVVDRVVVDAVVRDKKGRVLDELKKEDFRIFEEGNELPVSEFSKTFRPLALALVVDSSGSVTPFLEELQQAALKTLGRIGAEDLAALFVFSGEVGRSVDLTHNRELISEHIGLIRPNGKTNIFDAVAYASYYLATAAPGMQHAVIIISDNAANDIGQFGEGSAIRMALETETVVYSLRLPSATGTPAVLRSSSQPLWLGDVNLVNRISSATGGEIIELQDSGTLSGALQTIIDALKRRYCLSFTPPSRYGSRFRRIVVQLDDGHGELGKDYTVSARHGYYPFRVQ